MVWQAIWLDFSIVARMIVLTFAAFSWLLVLAALFNWTLGGFAVVGGLTVLRRSRPFVAMRWLGLLTWAATVTSFFALPTNFLEPLVLPLAAVNGLSAAVLLIGTARKRLLPKNHQTPASVKTLFPNSPAHRGVAS